jgi:hypothetical protein
MKSKYNYAPWSLHAISTVVAFLAVSAFSAQAAVQVWDGAVNGNWNTTDANFAGSAWTNGNSATFGGTAGSTVTINAPGISATGVTFDVNNDTIARTGSNTITLSQTSGSNINLITVGSGLTATINAPIAGTGGVQVENTGTGASILNLGGINTVDGGGNAAYGLIVGATTAGNTVNLSGGTMGTIGTPRRSLFIGSSGAAAGSASTGSNIVNISTAGTSLAPSFNVSGNGARATIGYASSSNELNISDGAYVSQQNGGGTNTWDMGVQANANSNKITVSGTNSSIVFGSNQSLNVGGAGDSNSVTVSAGGLISSRRFGIGINGGDTNSMTITGTNSQLTSSSTATASTNAQFEIGSTATSNGNFMSIAAGGKYTFLGDGQARYFDIGRAGDNNYLEVTGTNSQLNVTWANSTLPVTVGGHVTGPSTVTDGGTGNHLDINNGGAANLTNSSLYALGTNSAINLGNGTGVGNLTVGAATGYTAGVFLKNATGRLKINSGKLTAAAAGNLVSGAGKIDLAGDATVSTTFSSTIDVVIEDSTGSGGDFTKMGSGTLNLTQINTYSGDTIVTAGTLQMSNAYLADAAAVRLFSAGAGKLNLNTGGVTDTIGALYFDDVLQAAGTWGGTGSGADNINTTYFAANSGLLRVVAAVPEPGAALMGAVGLLTLLRRRRA